MMAWKCGTCNEPNSSYAAWCARCGAPDNNLRPPPPLQTRSDGMTDLRQLVLAYEQACDELRRADNDDRDSAVDRRWKAGNRISIARHRMFVAARSANKEYSPAPVGDGKTVPLEATDKMVAAGLKALNITSLSAMSKDVQMARKLYTAMVAACDPAPVEDGLVGHALNLIRDYPWLWEGNGETAYLIRDKIVEALKSAAATITRLEQRERELIEKLESKDDLIAKLRSELYPGSKEQT